MVGYAIQATFYGSTSGCGGGRFRCAGDEAGVQERECGEDWGGGGAVYGGIWGVGRSGAAERFGDGDGDGDTEGPGDGEGAGRWGGAGIESGLDICGVGEGRAEWHSEKCKGRTGRLRQAECSVKSMYIRGQTRLPTSGRTRLPTRVLHFVTFLLTFVWLFDAFETGRFGFGEVGIFGLREGEGGFLVEDRVVELEDGAAG